MPETTLILESFAAARNDLSFQVPIGRLRLLRSQIETRLGLPHCQEYNPAWSICCSEIAAVLTTAECKAALDKQVQVEEQTLRLNTLLDLCMSWPSYWSAQKGQRKRHEVALSANCPLLSAIVRAAGMTQILSAPKDCPRA